jgi:hypothetical protein
MGIAARIEKKWRRELRAQAARRRSMAPPAPGSLKPGDICPCGCGGRMQYVDGVLTAVTIDVVGRGGQRTRL